MTRMNACRLLFLLFLVGSVTAADFEAVVDDVVTAKVVSIKVLKGELQPGQDCIAIRQGQTVARLRVKTATGVCRVLEGDVEKGDQVRPAPKVEETAKPDDGKTAAANPVQAAPPVEGPLRTMLEAEGLLLLARHAIRQMPPDAQKTQATQLTRTEKLLATLAAAERAALGRNLTDRVAISLKDQGAPELAVQLLASPAEPVLAPIFPKAAEPFKPMPYGRLDLLATDPAQWALPQYWGRNPIDPVFTNIAFDQNSITFGMESEALVRRDVKLDDVEVSGQFKIEKGAFLYLILRSEVIVKFHFQNANAGVSLKAGYNNLSSITTASSIPPLDSGRWYNFKARLVQRQVRVELDGKEVLSTVVAFDPNAGAALPPQGYLGLGAHHAAGVFRNVQVQALTFSGQRSLPMFQTQLTYQTLGKEQDLLADSKAFVSLFGARVQNPLPANHVVEDGILHLKGASYSQFSVKDTEGDHFKVQGRVRVQEQGSVWIRANQSLLFGLLAKRQDRTQEAALEKVYYVKHTTGNFHTFDEAFDGTPLTPNQWYDWELEYHDPVGWFRLNGETIMVSRSPTDRGSNPGPNQFGVSAYNVQTDFRDLKFQRLKPTAPPAIDGQELIRLVDQGAALAKQAGEALAAAANEGELVAAEILAGERPPLPASAADYISLADDLRNRHQWPLALRILQANYERFAEDNPARPEAESYWRKTQQKFEIAQENVELGDLGLDNLMKVGSRPAAIANAREAGAVWMYVSGRERLQLFVPAKRESSRSFKPEDVEPAAILDRGDWLLVVDQEHTRIVKLDPATGKQLGKLELPQGQVLDWAPHPKLPKTYVCVDTNQANTAAVRQYKIFLLNEREMSLEDTGGYGMQVSVDPHGRYVYSSFNFRVTMNFNQFSPEPLALEMQRGGFVDHLVCFRIDGVELQPLSDRASPGVDGQDLVADPSGRLVCYAGRGGLQSDQKQEFVGPVVPAFRAGNVRTTVGVFNCGQNPKRLAFDPFLPKVYIYNGTTITAFSTQTFENLGVVDYPDAIKPNTGDSLQVTNDGAFLVFGFGGTSAGVFVAALSQTADPKQQRLAELLRQPAEELLEEARKLITEKKTDAAVELLELVVQTRAFSAAGEAAARELLGLNNSLFLAEQGQPPELPAPVLKDLDAPMTLAQIALPPAGKDTVQPATVKYGNRDDYRQRLADLMSYASLSTTYPMSWLWLCQRLDDDFPEAPDLLLLVARQLVDMKRPIPAEVVAEQLLKLSKGEGWYAVKAYGIIAENARLREQPEREIAARQAALKLNPRNPLMHARLGAALRRAGVKNQADYHDLLSLYLFPSQPRLRERLVAARLAEPLPAPKELTIEELYEQMATSVVLVKQRVGVGTGFFITRDGLVLTNHHVIAGGEDVLKVQVFRKGEDKPLLLPASVVATDAQLDIAVLAVDLGELQVEPLLLGDREAPKTGMKVIAIGNPGMGAQVLSRTVTEGIISNIRQKVGGQEYIQTSAAVNPGNSGGPLLNRNGRVIGMVTLKASLDNVGFAIPTERLLTYLEEQLQ